MLIDGLDDPKLLDMLLEGGVGVMPSDTIYGVMCRAVDQAAVAWLYRLKSRQRKPGTVIAANTQQLVELGIPLRYIRAVEQFWPGPISVIVPTVSDLHYLDHGMNLAVRVPADDLLVKLLEQTGPLLTSSANLPEQPPANNTDEARNYFGNRVDFYVNGGDLSGQPPSTIIRIIDDEIDILREGAVAIHDVERITV